MRIQKISIDKFNAFYGKEEFNVAGKNIFIYGENGSGKSSFYYALKDFFQSSTEDINLNELKNIFIDDPNAEASIEITFRPDANGIDEEQVILLSEATKAQTQIVALRDAIKLKSFLTYKHLLGVHNLKKGDKIDIFDLLVNGVLKHFKYTLTDGKELGQIWKDILDIVPKTVGKGADYTQTRQKQNALNTAIQIFNEAFGELFKVGSPEYILKYAQPILNQFQYGIEVSLDFKKTTALADASGIENNHVYLALKYHGRDIDEPQLFLNEAKLSAIAISIYLGLIKRHIQGIRCKILFLDDVFIGLDIANRIPLLNILKQEFSDYQVFMTTYDRPWYEYAKSRIEGDSTWKCFELYNKRSEYGFTIPIKLEHRTSHHVDLYFDKAVSHYQNGDYKASAVYLRTAFEYILKRYCVKNKITVPFRLSISDYDTDDFLNGINSVINQNKIIDDLKTAFTKLSADLSRELAGNIPEDAQQSIAELGTTINRLRKGIVINLTPQTQIEIETYRRLVLNPMSHSSTQSYGLSTELGEAIEVIRLIKDQLRVS
jgi:energy-coupling factor transporter ATP-binding protein EcfA2